MITRALLGLRTSYSTWLLAMTSSQITQSRPVPQPASTFPVVSRQSRAEASPS